MFEEMASWEKKSLIRKYVDEKGSPRDQSAQHTFVILRRALQKNKPVGSKASFYVILTQRLTGKG